jgi:hypothetical protein
MATGNRRLPKVLNKLLSYGRDTQSPRPDPPSTHRAIDRVDEKIQGDWSPKRNPSDLLGGSDLDEMLRPAIR